MIINNKFAGYQLTMAPVFPADETDDPLYQNSYGYLPTHVYCYSCKGAHTLSEVPRVPPVPYEQRTPYQFKCGTVGVLQGSIVGGEHFLLVRDVFTSLGKWNCHHPICACRVCSAE